MDLGATRRIRRAVAFAIVGAVLASACACAPESAQPTVAPSASVSSVTTPPAPATTAPSPTPAPTLVPRPTPTALPDPLAGMSRRERVAQLFMVGTDAESADRVTLAAVSDRRIGGIFLRGRSHAGTKPTSAVVSRFTKRLPADSPPLWVATDQEGGQVQVLSGRGFDDIPSALAQSKSGCRGLRADAARWGRQLWRAGVTMNLAPVADVVADAREAARNPPIGRLDRQYGYGGESVIRCAGAVASGFRSAGILPTFKHFPGLGRVTANTDYSADVVDARVSRRSTDVTVYRRLLDEGPAVVMMSSAVYRKIDRRAPAVFSKRVVTGLLRGDLGFDGVVMSDDLSATAAVARWAPGDRAVRAVEAGVDLILVSADASVFPEMYAAVLRAARADPAFAAQVDAAARRIVELKSAFPAGR